MGNVVCPPPVKCWTIVHSSVKLRELHADGDAGVFLWVCLLGLQRKVHYCHRRQGTVKKTSLKKTSFKVSAFVSPSVFSNVDPILHFPLLYELFSYFLIFFAFHQHTSHWLNVIRNICLQRLLCLRNEWLAADLSITPWHRHPSNVCKR